MDLTRLILFGSITGLILQWKQEGSRGWDYFKAAALGASGTVLGGFLALISYVTITNFSLTRLLTLLVTLSAGIVLTNSVLPRKV